jgi:predicted permease
VGVDASVLWVGVGLAVAAAVLLAFVPRLPTADAPGGLGVGSGGVRITSGTNRRLKLFAVTQIAASFVLLAGAAMLLTTLIALQRAPAGFETRRVLTVSVPVMRFGKTPEQIVAFYQDAMRQIEQLPGVDRVSLGAAMSFRGGSFGGQFTVEGYSRADGEEDPRARLRTVSPGFFASLGVPIIAGRDFDESDRRGGEGVVIVSQSVAKRMFARVDAAVNARLLYTDKLLLQFGGVSPKPSRIVGVAADIDDENIVPGPAMTVYNPLSQSVGASRLYVHTRNPDPYALVPPITRLIRQMSADQVIGRSATLQDVRAEVLAPERLNALVFGGFALVALTIALVGVAGVLAFSVSARTREFGIRLAIGSAPRHLLARVLGEGALIAAAGIVAGAVGGLVLTRVASALFGAVRTPGALPIAGAAMLLVTAAILASLLPAARASRVDVVEALRSE